MEKSNKKSLDQIICLTKPSESVQGKERVSLVKELCDIARNGFGTEVTKEDVENHVLKVDELYLLMQNEKLVGFSSYDNLNIENKGVLYLNGIVVLRSYQKNGLFYSVNNLVIDKNKPDYLAMRTQNPVIYAATQRIVKKLHPGNNERSEDVDRIAKAIALNHLKMKSFDEKNMVHRGTYGSSMYDYVPSHKRSDEFFSKELKLDYEKGDSVLLVGELK